MKGGCNGVPVSFSEKDLSLLQKFSPSLLKLKIVRNFSELETRE